MTLPNDEKSRLENSSAAYHGKFNNENQRNIEWVSNRIVHYATNKDVILELGLGDGVTTKVLSDHFGRVITLDGSRRLIDNFKNNFSLSNVTLIETFFEDFATDERFPNIAISNILEHVFDPGVIVEKYKSFLSPGGRFYFCVPSATSLNRRIGNQAGLLPDIFAFQEQDHILGHRRYYSSETFIRFLEDHHFKIEIVEGVNLKVITTGQMEQLNFSPAIYRAMLEIGVKYPELSTMVFVVASL